MPISTADIRPGDLLLFRGSGFLSWAIRKIDGSEVNHAAIALAGGQLAEAAGQGLRSRPIPTTFSEDEYMLVRRHLATDPYDPVIAKAQTYLDNRNFYAYQQIVLLAVLGVTRKIPARGVARRMIRSALDHAARAVMDLLPLGASWMICSEYVYRCFDEAVDVDPDPFTVRISGVDYAAPVYGQESWADWAERQAGGFAVDPVPSFAAAGFDEEAAEAELAPLIAEWAAFAGVDDGDPLPASDLVPVAFATSPAEMAAEAQQDEVPDEELEQAMVQFGEALKVARLTAPGVPVSFGLVPAAVGSAAVRGAIRGLRELTVDPNFVTPKDLLVSNSFGPVERVR